jgi:hypothetical protein
VNARGGKNFERAASNAIVLAIASAIIVRVEPPRMTTLPRHLASLALAALLGILVAPRSGMAEEQSHIRITGRVVDKSGVPLRDTWVVTQGSRRTGALTGAGGRYTLDVVGGSSSEITRNPLLIRIQARRQGWKMTVPGGAPELAIEMRIENDSLGGSRFLVRSNDPRVAAMLADDAVLQNGTRVTLQLDFVGVRGAQPENEVVDMAAVQEVVLAAPHPPPVVETLALATPLARDDEKPAGAGHGPAADSAQANAEPGGAADPPVARPRPLDPVSELLANARTAREASAAAVPSDSEIEPMPSDSGSVPLATESESRPEMRSPKRAASHKVAPATKRPAILPPDSEAQPLAQKIEEAPPAPAAVPAVADAAVHAPDRSAPSNPPKAPTIQESVNESPAVAETPRPEKKKGSKRTRVVRPAEAEDAAPPSKEDLRREEERPRVIRPGDPEAQAAEVAKRMRKPRARPATAEEIRHALQLLGESPPPSPASSTGSAPTSTSGAAAVPVALPTTPAPQAPILTSTSAAAVPPATRAPEAPMPSPPTSAPMQPSNGGALLASATPMVSDSNPPSSSVAIKSGASGDSDSCGCRIEGTVEVVSDDPLPERMQVDISIADDHRVTDTVELFMGSPRVFELDSVSCGSHALRVKVRSKLKFMLSAPLPMIDCAGGGYRQARILLEPLQKKRAAR